ncbi:hypothetical protein ['Catharanthus roseus' aster yellows phytoplasma]|uniref:Uncharacterized protein n=1 Tax='Catharanthus roseus' aster yellows phytoplasma TaxID=1193712 RepID=A0A4P6MAD7_9MOLU|nr:hypothetical protein ['Catharanthus roseus' aster yellows phytoplasma]QBF23794.1 hypothetical protein EXT02_01100 ['Catharanthus roseus' aster yellows phytoplasma]
MDPWRKRTKKEYCNKYNTGSYSVTITRGGKQKNICYHNEPIFATNNFFVMMCKTETICKHLYNFLIQKQEEINNFSFVLNANPYYMRSKNDLLFYLQDFPSYLENLEKQTKEPKTKEIIEKTIKQIDKIKNELLGHLEQIKNVYEC